MCGDNDRPRAFDMRPVSPAHDGADVTLTEPVNGGYVALQKPVVKVLPNCSYLVVRKTRASVGRAFGLPSPVATFGDHVLDIFELCAKEEMVRSDAKSNVAMVKDRQARRYRAKVKLPRKLVGADVALASSAARDIPIANGVAHGGTGPKPTAIGLLDLGPEAFG